MALPVDFSPLGQKTDYVSHYDASLLFPIPRAASRAGLGIEGQLPFSGYDIWTGYELSWLNLKGKPQVAVAEFSFPCDSPNIIESKSFKLYLNSFNQTGFASWEEVQAQIKYDLSAAAGGEVSVSLQSLAASRLLVDLTYPGICLDGLDIDVLNYHPSPELLTVNATGRREEKLYSHLLKSNCPVNRAARLGERIH